MSALLSQGSVPFYYKGRRYLVPAEFIAQYSSQLCQQQQRHSDPSLPAGCCLVTTEGESFPASLSILYTADDSSNSNAARPPAVECSGVSTSSNDSAPHSGSDGERPPANRHSSNLPRLDSADTGVSHTFPATLADTTVAAPAPAAAHVPTEPEQPLTLLVRTPGGGCAAIRHEREPLSPLGHAIATPALLEAYLRARCHSHSSPRWWWLRFAEEEEEVEAGGEAPSHFLDHWWRLAAVVAVAAALWAILLKRLL